MTQQLTRRAFLKGAACAAAVTAAAPLAGCDMADRVIMHTRTITDHAGRELEIPTADSIKTVFFTSGLAQVYITALAPELLGASAAKFTEEELEFLPDGVENLPYLGTLNNNDEIDREQLLLHDFDIMFSISGIELTQQNISEAEDIQA